MPSKTPYAPQPSAAHARFIDDIGGPHAVARAVNAQLGTGLTGQAVTNWKRRGIPFRYRATLIVMAQAKGVEAPGNFLGSVG